MWDYINEQVDVLNKILNNEEKTFSSIDSAVLNKKNIIITASGSSLNAAMILKPIVESEFNVSITIENPFHLRNYSNLLKSETKDKLLIALSQTGKSIGTLECIKEANKSGLETIGITANEDSQIAKECKIHINMLCGNEDVGPKTKGFTATVLTLHLLLIKLLNDHRKEAFIEEYRRSILEIPRNVEDSKVWCEAHKDWAKANVFSIVGFGVNNATAREGSLKVLETMQIPVMNFDMEEFMHGPHRTIVSDSYLMYIDTEGEGKVLMNNLITFTKTKTENYLLISTLKDKDNNTISIGKYPLTNSWVNAVIPFQVICTYFPEVNGVNSSEPIYGNFATTVGTRVE